MRYQLLALDLDGTIIGRDLSIPAGLSSAIQAFQARGGRVTIATGAPYAQQRRSPRSLVSMGR
jgi:hydroxymethylpyrimidine pyrophosphatase-like HAD family hydrolase